MVTVAHRSWPELLFHLLAHVAVEVPASVYDPVYVQWVASQVGPAEGRTLGEDARLLARLLPTHPTLAAVQLLAWLFDDVEQARSCAETDLADLSPPAVARPELLDPLGRLGAPVEILRCAAQLEVETFAALPPVAFDVAAVQAAVADLAGVAPGLASAKLVCLRALRRRGRVRGDEIFVGCPDSEVGPTVEHVAWQAAHEATVVEIGKREAEQGRPWMDRERQVEQEALSLLAQRAASAGKAEAHRLWRAALAQPRLRSAT